VLLQLVLHNIIAGACQKKVGKKERDQLLAGSF